LDLLWKYGLATKTASDLGQSTKKSFLGMYDTLQKTQFENHKTFMQSMNLYDLGSETFGGQLKHHGIGDDYIYQYATAMMRFSYGQNSSANAFAGYVVLIGASGAKGEFLAINQGNRALVVNLMSHSGAELRLNTRVTKVIYQGGQPDKKLYKVIYEGGEQEFDSVVLAVPLEFAKIEFEGVPSVDGIENTRIFKKIHATIVDGFVNEKYFGVEVGDVSEELMTMDIDTIPFNSLSKKTGSRYEGGIYKLFSSKEIKDEDLNKLFKKKNKVWKSVWDHAFPVMDPSVAARGGERGKDTKFILGEKLYYVNAVESFVSAVELMTMGAENVVNLLRRDFGDTKPAVPVKPKPKTDL